MAQPQSAPPAEALQFLFFLSSVEKFIRSGLGNSQEDDDEVVLRTKVAAYEQELSERLERWPNLCETAKCHYKVRIEDLKFELNAALERRRAVAVAAEISLTQADEKTIHTSGEEVDESSELINGGETDVIEATKADVASFDARDELLGVHHVSKAKDTGLTRKSRAQVEDDILKLSGGMKDLATGFHANLRLDNERLGSVSSLVQKNLDGVTEQNKIGRNVLWSGQIGFLQTVVMLIISILIFCAMVPFILFS